MLTQAKYSAPSSIDPAWDRYITTILLHGTSDYPSSLWTSGGHKNLRGNLLKNLLGFPIALGNMGIQITKGALTSIQGSPLYVEGNVKLYNSSSLSSLEGGPVYVGKGYEVQRCSITSCKGMPVYVGHSVYLYDNSNLTSLEGLPKYIGAELSIDKSTIRKLIDIGEITCDLNSVAIENCLIDKYGCFIEHGFSFLSY